MSFPRQFYKNAFHYLDIFCNNSPTSGKVASFIANHAEKKFRAIFIAYLIIMLKKDLWMHLENLKIIVGPKPYKLMLIISYIMIGFGCRC